MPEVPVELHFPVGLIGNDNLETLLVYLRRVPNIGEAIYFDDKAGLDGLNGCEFTVRMVRFPVKVIAPGINPPPIAVLMP